MTGAQGLENASHSPLRFLPPTATGGGRKLCPIHDFGVDVEKAFAGIYQAVFRAVGTVAFPKHTPPKFLMLY